MSKLKKIFDFVDEFFAMYDVIKNTKKLINTSNINHAGMIFSLQHKILNDENMKNESTSTSKMLPNFVEVLKYLAILPSTISEKEINKKSNTIAKCIFVFKHNIINIIVKNSRVIVKILGSILKYLFFSNFAP